MRTMEEELLGEQHTKEDLEDKKKATMCKHRVAFSPSRYEDYYDSLHYINDYENQNSPKDSFVKNPVTYGEVIFDFVVINASNLRVRISYTGTSASTRAKDTSKGGRHIVSLLYGFIY